MVVWRSAECAVVDLFFGKSDRELVTFMSNVFVTKLLHLKLEN